MTVLLKNGQVIDSKNKINEKLDILINEKTITQIEKNILIDADEIIDCTNLVIIPGIFDMHVHFRDPGQTHKEDIISGGEAAVRGGVTGVLCMPNTFPVVDTPAIVEYIRKKAEHSKVKVYMACAITKGFKGEELCDFSVLKKAGAIAVTDDGKPVKNARLMGEAMVKAHEENLLIISHCEDLDIINGGIINEGKVSKTLQVKGMSRCSENIITSREIDLAECLNVPVHIAHISTKEATEKIKYAKQKGIKVTCETAPHYFTLTEECLLKRDADYRMNPPLREISDTVSIEKAIGDGTVDVLITDHAPHTKEEKADFMNAPNGVVGLETSLAVTLTQQYHTGKLPLEKIVELMCEKPRKLLGIEGGGLAVGDNADIAVINLNEEWEVIPDKLRSKSKNTCFKGLKLKGKVIYTLVDGKIVFNEKMGGNC